MMNRDNKAGQLAKRLTTGLEYLSKISGVGVPHTPLMGMGSPFSNPKQSGNPSPSALFRNGKTMRP